MVIYKDTYTINCSLEMYVSKLIVICVGMI